MQSQKTDRGPGRHSIGVAIVAAMTATIILGSIPAGAGVGDYVWSADIGSSGGGLADTDPSGNFVVHGAFFGTLVFGTDTLTSVNIFDGDQYLVKFDSNGNYVWSKQFVVNGSGASNEHVAVDPAGNIYITGHMFANTDVDYGGGPVAGSNVYIAAFNSSGVHQWSNSFGDGQPQDIDATSTHVYVSGYTSAGVDFGGGTIGLAGGNDGFVAKLTGAGGHVWSQSYGDAVDQSVYKVAVDPFDNVYLLGSLFGTTDFGGGPLVANSHDIAVAKLNASGAHRWSHIYDGVFKGGLGILWDGDIAAGPNGEVVFGGELRSTVDFGGGGLTPHAFGDIFVVSLDTAGTHNWSANYGSAAGTEKARCFAIDQRGNVLMGANLKGDASVGGDTLQFNGGSFDNNIVYALYDAAGSHLWSGIYGPSGYPFECRFDSSSNFLLYGSGAVDLGGGALNNYGWIAKLSGGGAIVAVDDAPKSGNVGLRAYPNPFNPTTTIEYTLATPGVATISVYDVRGRLVETLAEGKYHAPGQHTLRFNAKASGVYFVKLATPSATEVRKIVAVK